MISKSYIGKDVEGNGCNLLRVSPPDLYVETEENSEKMPGRFETLVHRLQVRCFSLNGSVSPI
jgi:hypothetical protein